MESVCNSVTLPCVTCIIYVYYRLKNVYVGSKLGSIRFSLCADFLSGTRVYV